MKSHDLLEVHGPGVVVLTKEGSKVDKMLALLGNGSHSGRSNRAGNDNDEGKSSETCERCWVTPYEAVSQCPHASTDCIKGCKMAKGEK